MGIPPVLAAPFPPSAPTQDQVTRAVRDWRHLEDFRRDLASRPYVPHTAPHVSPDGSIWQDPWSI